MQTQEKKKIKKEIDVAVWESERIRAHKGKKCKKPRSEKNL